MRIVEAREPDYDRSHHYHEASPFPAKWVAHPDAPRDAVADAVFVARYAVSFESAGTQVARIHVSADERYVLALDGRPLGRGPERSDLNHWHFETYQLALSTGRHELTAVVHSLGRHRPYAQMSLRHALLVMGEGALADVLSTGVAPWTAEHLDGFTAVPVALPGAFVAIGARCRIDGAALLRGSLKRSVVNVGPLVLASMRMESPAQWQLCPARLPPMQERPLPPGVVRRIEGPGDAGAWQNFLRIATPVVVPPRTTLRVLIDLDDYACVYPRLAVRGGAGAEVALHFAEALFKSDGRTKAHRDHIDGLRFVGMGDTYVCPGPPITFEPLWWLAGRYVELSVTTQAEPLTLESLKWIETRYPLTWDSAVEVEDATFTALTPLARRALETCAHETFYDCPYYEQLMYVGDARIEALVTYAHCGDDRLPRKAVQLFNQSRTPDGWTQSRYPTKSTQTIPPFAWWWVGMVHDLAMWRDHPKEVRAHLPGVRAVMEAGYARVNGDDLFQPGTGWYFVDWVAGWPGGTPPGGASEPVAPIHLQLAYTAGLAAELEDIVAEPLLAQRHRQMQGRLLRGARAAFYDEARGLFADDTRKTRFSEHAQSLAVLAGAADHGIDRERLIEGLITASDLSRTTIYYTHYLFEAYRQLGRVDALFARLPFWAALADGGFKTTPEQPEPSRSDCHAWGAHPLYHVVATVLGVRPAAAGFKHVTIAPQLGPLDSIRGRVIHPRGMIEVEAWREDGRLRANMRLPDGVSGTLHLNGTAEEVISRR